MSTTHQQVMESSLALGRLELTPSAAAVGVGLTPRISAGAPAKEKSGPRAVGSQGPAHLNGCVPLSHQVAGHKYGVDKVGILQHPDGTVLKQLQPPPRGPREKQFYGMVYAEDCCDPRLLELQNHLPKYYGTWSSPDSPNDLYLKLEDVTRRFRKPCIMDVKLGQRSYDPFASQEKREQQIRKYPLMEEIGFLVLGMRVYKLCSDTFDSYDQHYGRGLVKDTIKEGLAKFFNNGVCLRKDAVSASISRVRHILRWFESQQQLVFYASSLLFVYEGLPSSLSSILRGPTLDGSRGATEERPRQEVAGRKEEVAEYNNNNIQVAAPWDYRLANMYAIHRKGGLQHCAKGCLHGNGGDDGALTTLTTAEISSPEGNAPPPPLPPRQQDNTAWNGNKPQPEGKEEGGGAGEEGEEGRTTPEGGATERGDGDVEVRMIDFAHVFPSDSQDHGYIYGLKHLLRVLEQILSGAP